MTSEPVFLYNDPHPVHRRMAEAIDAEFVAANQGSPLDRLRSATTRDFGNRPVLIEGGVPLVEAGFLDLLGRTGPVIELAADATLIDLAIPLSGRPRIERLAHRFGEMQVDATLAVSDTIAAYARRYDRPVRVIHPFVLEEVYNRLIDLDPGGEGETLLCVGKYVEKNGQDILVRALDRLQDSVTAHFVGPGTETIDGDSQVIGHGFVERDRLVELFDRADLMVFPARIGAYPVAVLEALVSATPVITTPCVGNADLIRALDTSLVTEPESGAVASSIERGLATQDQALGERARALGRNFTADRHLSDFVNRFNEIVAAASRS